jgi:hypothetical protein
VAQHSALRLPLEGRHATITCAACHAASRTGLSPVPRPESLGSAHVMLAMPERECQSCHVDPHAGRYLRGGAFPLQRGCAECHGAKSFRPSLVSVETHARFSFALDGAHRATPCMACHAEFKAVPAAATLVRNNRGVVALPFSATRSTTCVSCHANPHGAQFATRKDGGKCEACHATAGFVPASRFDHEKDAAFPLSGAHAKVPCARCHRSAAPGAPVVYRPLSAKCESCHSGRMPRVH